MVNHDSQAVLVPSQYRPKPVISSNQLARQLRSCKVCRFRKVKVRPDPILLAGDAPYCILVGKPNYWMEISPSSRGSHSTGDSW